MSFPNSAGAYSRVQDQSFIVSAGGVISGGVVISSNRGTVGTNLVTSAKQFVEQYGKPDRDNPSMFAAYRFLERAGILTVRRVISDATKASGVLQDAGELNDLLTVTAENEGAWGNNITVSFATIIGAPSTQFSLIVKENGVEVERFTVSRDPEEKDGFNNNVFVEDVVNTQSNYIRVVDNAAVAEAYDLAATITLTGGANDTTPVASGDIVSAWDEFNNPEQISASLLINAGFTAAEIQTKMLAVAESRRDSFAILDVPLADAEDVSAMITHRDTTLAANTYWGAMYGGWLRVYDQFGDREVTIPSSGDVAAVFAYTVETGERWDAPAGLQRGVIPNALGVSKVFTEGERDLLYTNGINPVTTYAGTAAVVWGQKTLQQQTSALSSVNVVNLVTWANLRMREALTPFVFQPNTQFTRDNVNYLITSFLTNIRQNGGLYNFSVDTSTDINTPFVIDNNQMKIDIFLQPTRTAEFIQLTTTITPTGVELG